MRLVGKWPRGKIRLWPARKIREKLAAKFRYDIRARTLGEFVVMRWAEGPLGRALKGR